MALETLDDFFDLNDFAVEGVYTPSPGSPRTIKCIFDSSFQAVNLDTGVVESAGPQAVVKDSDITGAKHGETLVINSTTYYIRGIQPDGTGLTVLALSKD